MAWGFAFAMRRQLVLFLLLLAVAQRALGQGVIGSETPCDQDPNDGVTENLSCPSLDPTVLQCYPPAQLCDGTRLCAGGSDEGANIVSLVCGEFG